MNTTALKEDLAKDIAPYWRDIAGMFILRDLDIKASIMGELQSGSSDLDYARALIRKVWNAFYITDTEKMTKDFKAILLPAIDRIKNGESCYPKMDDPCLQFNCFHCKTSPKSTLIYVQDMEGAEGIQYRKDRQIELRYLKEDVACDEVIDQEKVKRIKEIKDEMAAEEAVSSTHRQETPDVTGDDNPYKIILAKVVEKTLNDSLHLDDGRCYYKNTPQIRDVFAEVKKDNPLEYSKTIEPMLYIHVIKKINDKLERYDLDLERCKKKLEKELAYVNDPKFTIHNKKLTKTKKKEYEKSLTDMYMREKKDILKKVDMWTETKSKAIKDLKSCNNGTLLFFPL